MAEAVGDRLARLLGLLPYLARAHRPLPIAQVAEHFGVSEAQIRSDLRALWLVGTPGMGYDDMLQFGNYEYDDDYVDLRDARGLTQPLRLSFPEAVALSAALRALQPIVAPRAELAPVVASTLAKLDAVTSADPPNLQAPRNSLSSAGRLANKPGEPPERDRLPEILDVRLPRPGDPNVAQAVTTALVGGRQLQIDYVDAADHASNRRVDPLRLHLEGGTAYLVAWCQQAGGKRTFRLDRILAAEVLAAEVEHRDVDASALDIASDDAAATEVTITLDGAARWLVEELPIMDSTEFPDGTVAIRLQVRNPDWLRRLLLAQARHVIDLPPELAADVATAARAALAHYPSE